MAAAAHQLRYAKNCLNCLYTPGWYTYVLFLRVQEKWHTREHVMSEREWELTLHSSTVFFTVVSWPKLRSMSDVKLV